jgi:hypothetical protein
MKSVIGAVADAAGAGAVADKAAATVLTRITARRRPYPTAPGFPEPANENGPAQKRARAARVKHA